MISSLMLRVSTVLLLVGMVVGIIMGMQENFTLAPAHAHLNLLGWVTMGLYGTFYALTRGTMSVRLAWLNYVLAALGVAVTIPTLALTGFSLIVAFLLFAAAGPKPPHHVAE